MKRPGAPASLLFRLIVPVCALFILTILALIASVFGDPRAPVSQWLDRHGTQFLLYELVAIVVLILLAMTVDRIRTLRAAPETSSDEPQPTDPVE